MASHAPLLRALLLASGLGVAAVACQRHEADLGGAATAQHGESISSAHAESPAAPPSAKRCVYPLPESPPPKALRASACPADPTGPPTLPKGWVSFPEAPGEPRIAVEIAATNDSRERGLMYRTSMPEDQGMIFSWPEEARRSFWMHDTCISLDMLYIAADGTITGVLEQVPPMDETPRGVPCPVSYVLEVNAGWTRAHGVAPGQRAHFET